MEIQQTSHKQLLFALHKRKKRKGEANRDHLEKLGQAFFREEMADWEEAYGELEALKLITQADGIFALTPAGIPVARRVAREFMIHNYNESYIFMEESQAFQHYCREVYGRALGQINLSDMAVIDCMIELLGLKMTQRALDLGCGIGRISEYVAEQTGAEIIGIDLAERAIQAARQRVASKQTRVSYQVGDIEALHFEPQSFDAVFCVDSLYEMTVEQLIVILKRLRTLLRDGGQMAFTFGNNGRKGKRFQPSETKLGLALAELGYPFQVEDLTPYLNAMWQRSLAAADALRPEFSEEHNEDFCDGLRQHAALNLKFADFATLYLFHVSWEQ